MINAHKLGCFKTLIPVTAVSKAGYDAVCCTFLVTAVRS